MCFAVEPVRRVARSAREEYLQYMESSTRNRADSLRYTGSPSRIRRKQSNQREQDWLRRLAAWKQAAEANSKLYRAQNNWTLKQRSVTRSGIGILSIAHDIEWCSVFCASWYVSGTTHNHLPSLAPSWKVSTHLICHSMVFITDRDIIH